MKASKLDSYYKFKHFFHEINEAMNLCIDAINTEIQEKIDFINGLDEDNA